MSDLSLLSHFADLEDPRVERSRRHNLLDIIALTICGAIAGMKQWTEIEEYARNNEDWLRSFLELPNGVPSHDTFGRVFARLDPEALGECLGNWIAQVSATLEIRHVAIDGKTLRHSFDNATGKAALHLVSAWATEQHLSLGQVAVDDKSNEITAIPKLLELLDLHGALVTIDAMGTQKEIARKIRQGGADYVLAVKGNQEHLLQDVQGCFAKALDGDDGHDFLSMTERGHGRIETRLISVINTPQGIRDLGQWKDLKAICMVVSERHVVATDTTTMEVRYFIGSRKGTAKEYARYVREHWAIENRLHWVLDVQYNEDQSRTRKGHGQQNLARMRRLAVSLLKNDTSKGSIRRKQIRACTNPTFLLKVLNVFSQN